MDVWRPGRTTPALTMYLRADVFAEPLVDGFPAWLGSLAPVPAATRLAGVQVPRLEACLRRPEDGELRALEAAALLDVIERDRVDMLRFAAAVAAAEDLLRRHPGGADLPALHRRLPGPLHGLVELAYDAAGRPAMRFLETLLYESPVYDTGRQSIQFELGGPPGGVWDLDEPRLPGPDKVELPVPFHHPQLDELFAARIRPTDPTRLRVALGLDDWQAPGLDRLFTAAAPARSDRHLGRGARIRYFGRACLVLQTPEVAVVTDPCLDAGCGYTIDDLPDHIDLVLITSGHPDHLALGTLLQLRPRIGAVVVPRSSRGNPDDPSIGRCLKALGFRIVETDDLDEIPLAGGRVVATPHQGGHDGHDVRAKSTYVVQIADAAVFVGGRSAGHDPALHRRLRARLGRVDMAFLGAPADAVGVVAALDADEAYLYGDYDPAGDRIRDFLGWCAGHGIIAEHLRGPRDWRW